MSEITQDNYREFDAINYSKLSSLAQHPSKVLEEKEVSEGMRSGDLLDIFVYEGEEAVHDKYYVSTLTSLPTDIMKDIVEQSPNFEDATLVQTARDLDYGGSNWKDSTILRKIEEQAGEYMMELENAGDRPIISWEQFTEAQQAANLLRNHEFTTDFFGPEWDYQVPLKEKLDIGENPFSDGSEVLFKCLLDGIKEDDDLIHIHDLKFTSSELSKFSGQFFYWRYYLQAAIYSDIVRKKNPGKTVLYTNVVYSKYDRKVQRYLIDESAIIAGRNGYDRPSGQHVKGYKRLAMELLWHQQNNKWDYPFDVYSNGGMEVIRMYDS